MKTTTKNQNKTKSRKDSKSILHSATGIGENMIYISAEASVIVQGLVPSVTDDTYIQFFVSKYLG